MIASKTEEPQQAPTISDRDDLYRYQHEVAGAPAVAHLYPLADFSEIYQAAKRRPVQSWSAEDFSEVALGREIERLRTGSEVQFRRLFDGLRATHQRAIEVRAPGVNESEASRLARKQLQYINSTEETALIHANVVVPPDLRDSHEESVTNAMVHSSMRKRIELLRSCELVREGAFWAFYVPAERGGPYATRPYPEKIWAIADELPQEWEALLVDVDQEMATALGELLSALGDASIRKRLFPEWNSGHENVGVIPEQHEQERDDVTDNETNRTNGGKVSVATRMVQLALNRAALFNDGNRGYATAQVGGHRECWPIQSNGFRTWLISEIYSEEGRIPSGTAIADARNVVEGLALAEGLFAKPALRVAGTADHIYIDLGDAMWNCVSVTRAGWSIVAHPDDVLFIRPADFGELPTPQQGRDLELLRQFVNLTDEQLRLFQTFLLAACHPQGPYVQLVSCGVPGATKSSLQKVAKALIDPSTRPANSPAPVSLSRRPTKSGDLFVAGSNSHLVSADNLSHINDELSDEFCCLATGDAWKTRKLYTNFDEASIDVCRPAMLNGISNPVRRSDHGERAILIETTKPRKVIDEDDYWRLFEEARPFLLGALYDALAIVIERRLAINLPITPRMVGFVRVGTAAAQ